MDNNFIDIPEKKTFLELGLDDHGQNPMKFFGAEENKLYKTSYSDGVSASNILGGDMISTLTVRGTIYVNDGVHNRILIGEGKGLF